MGFSQVFDRFATLPPAEVARALDAFRREVAVMASVHSSKVVAARGCCTREPGRAPCVLHSNGKMAKPKMATVFGCKPDDAWIVPAGKAGAAGGVAAARGNLTAQRQAAALLFPTTH